MTDYELVDGVWNRTVISIDENGDEKLEWNPCLVTDIPVTILLEEWEDLVLELSQKEIELLKLKEYIQSESFHIETTFDFKEAYGKNNADIRKQHIKVELSEVFDKVQGLEFSINWIRNYIPLLKEVIRCKQ